MKKNFWKMLSIMMVALLSFGFVSCGDDDDEGGSVSISESLLYGLWEGYSVTGTYQGKSFTQTFDPRDADRLEVKKDKTYNVYTYKDDSNHPNGEWVIRETGTWELKGNKLVATEDNRKQHTIIIHKVTSDTFIYEPTERADDDEAPAGTTYKITYKRVR